MTPPAAAAAPAVHRGRTAAPARPLRTAPGPRRVSGPARRALPRRPVQRPARAEAGLALGLLALLRGLARHRLLDRLIAGRAWIALVAFALIGIVTLQLGLLKLNTGIGRSLEREALLQRENAELSIEDSELAAGDRIESGATRLGMELVPVGALRFLAVRSGVDVARAAASLSTPVQASSTGAAEATAGASATTATAAPPSNAAEQTASAAASPSPSDEALASPTGGPVTSAGESVSAASAQPSVAAAPSTAGSGAPAGSAAGGSGEAAPAGDAGGAGGAGGTQSAPTG